MRTVTTTVIVLGLSLSMCLAQASMPASAPAALRPATCPADLNAIAGQKGLHPASEDAFHFVVISDNTGGEAPGRWQEAISEINLLHPDFVISVGDFIAGYQKDPQRIVKMWDHFDEINSQLDAPFFFCAGNHDVTNEVARPIYAQRHGVNGKSYYSFDYKGCHFIVLDADQASSVREFASEQKAWAEKDLAAAKDARHIFMFSHFPVWMKTRDDLRWVTKAVEPGKMTVFSGHTHEWTYTKVDGVDDYVIAPTGAMVESGKYGRNMFAQVWVEQGQPSVSIISVGAVKPGEYADKDAVAVVKALDISPIDISGGELHLKLPNPLSRPAQVELRVSGKGWKVEPVKRDLAIAPNGCATGSFKVTPTSDQPGRLTAFLSGETTNADGNVIKFSDAGPVTVRRLVDIPAVCGIVVDGKCDDWKIPPALNMTGDDFVYYEPREGGPMSSGQWWIGHDDKTLYGCVKVTGDAPLDPGNGVCKFFWDARPADKQNGQHGAGTGSFEILTPSDGAPAEAKWTLAKQPKPEGLKVAWAKSDDGYVYEWSVPLSEMGLPPGATAVNVEVQYEAVFGSYGTGVTEYMSSSGHGKGSYETSHYCRGTLK